LEFSGDDIVQNDFANGAQLVVLAAQIEQHIAGNGPDDFAGLWVDACESMNIYYYL
jgi:hypothetical protein